MALSANLIGIKLQIIMVMEGASGSNQMSKTAKMDGGVNLNVNADVGAPSGSGPQDQPSGDRLSLTTQQLTLILQKIKDNPSDEDSRQLLQILKRHPQLMVAIIKQRKQSERSTSGADDAEGGVGKDSQQQQQLEIQQIISQLQISLNLQEQQPQQHMPSMQTRFMLPQYGPDGRIVRIRKSEEENTSEESINKQKSTLR